jgi:hypothetical protein
MRTVNPKILLLHVSMATFGFLLPVWDFAARLGFCCSFGFLLLIFRQPSNSTSSPSSRSASSIGSSQMGCSFCGWVVVSAYGFLIL